MELSDFESSLSAAAPPAKLSRALRALWWDAKGDWNAAHECAQADEGNPECDWVHAYLHRKEGDLGNADYWYRRAGKRRPDADLGHEWAEIASDLFERSS